MFSRINAVIDDNDMLRGEQYGGINGRQIQNPIRILAELIECANVTKKELHIFSADLSHCSIGHKPCRGGRSAHQKTW